LCRWPTDPVTETLWPILNTWRSGNPEAEEYWTYYTLIRTLLKVNIWIGLSNFCVSTTDRSPLLIHETLWTNFHSLLQGSITATRLCADSGFCNHKYKQASVLISLWMENQGLLLWSWNIALVKNFEKYVRFVDVICYAAVHWEEGRT